MVAADRLWYGVVTALATAYYFPADDSAPTFLRRPFWSPPGLLRLACCAHVPARIALALLGGALAASDATADSAWWRAAFALALFVADCGYFAGYPCHPGFVLLYTSAAMCLPPGPARSGVLRVVVAHQLGAPGLNKVRVSGAAAWLSPATLTEWLTLKAPLKPHFLVEPIWVKQWWLVKIVLARPRLRSALNAAGLAFELGALPVALCGGELALLALFVAGCIFHIGVALLVRSNPR